MRNAMDAQEVAIGWWPGDARYDKARFTPMPTRRRKGSKLPAPNHPDPLGRPAGGVRPGLGRRAHESSPHGTGLAFARSVFRHACLVCDWDPALAATAEGKPPPVV